MVGLLFKFSIKFLIWYLKREHMNNNELVIRNDGWTIYRRDFKKEESIKKTFDLIK